MNKLQQYTHDYEAVRQKIKHRPTVDLTLLHEVGTTCAVPVAELLEVDTEDEPARKRLTEPVLSRLRAYFKGHPEERTAVFSWLSPRDETPVAGVLLLYGAGGTARPRQVAALYRLARQPVIVSDADSQVRSSFEKVLLERGVNKSDIHYETKARNYLENAYYSLELMQSSFPAARQATIVTESLVARRALVATRMYADPSHTLSSYPMIIDEENRAADTTAPDTWYSSELGLKMVLNEIVSFELYRRFNLLAAL